MRIGRPVIASPETRVPAVRVSPNTGSVSPTFLLVLVAVIVTGRAVIAPMLPVIDLLNV